MIERAAYGRMRLGRCVETDMGHVGCQSDVLQTADRRCSGRTSCEIRVPDAELEKTEPCLSELKTYLEITYRCLTGTYTAGTLVVGLGLALRTINVGLGLGIQGLSLDLRLRTHGLGLGLVIKVLALTLRPKLKPGQTQCHCFIITLINADEFNPDLFPLCKLNEQFSLLKPLPEIIFCVPASSAPVERVFFQ